MDHLLNSPNFSPDKNSCYAVYNHQLSENFPQFNKSSNICDRASKMEQVGILNLDLKIAKMNRNLIKKYVNLREKHVSHNPQEEHSGGSGLHHN